MIYVRLPCGLHIQVHGLPLGEVEMSDEEVPFLQALPFPLISLAMQDIQLINFNSIYT